MKYDNLSWWIQGNSPGLQSIQFWWHPNMTFSTRQHWTVISVIIRTLYAIICCHAFHFFHRWAGDVCCFGCFFPYVPGSFEGPGACESITIKSVCSLISWPLGRNTCCYSGAISNLFISYMFLHWFAYDHFFCLALPTRDLGHLIPSGNLTWRWTFSTVHLIMLENHL